MSKADKIKIEKLEMENLRIMGRIAESTAARLQAERREGELIEKLQQEKEKYACLLERYISLMEKVGMLDGRKETD